MRERRDVYYRERKPGTAKPGNAKLNPELVREIRAATRTGKYSYTEIANAVGVSPKCISEIVQRKTWADV